MWSFLTSYFSFERQCCCYISKVLDDVGFFRVYFSALVFKDIDGILVPGGFGSRGIEGKIKAINYARVNNTPFLGICLGMQLAVIELASVI